MNKSISNEIQNNLNHLEYSIIDVRQNITILIQNIDIRQSFEMSIYFSIIYSDLCMKLHYLYILLKKIESPK